MLLGGERMKLKFTEESLLGYWIVQEDGKDTEKTSYEILGIIFKDELGIHWNIHEDYSGIIELEELKQITNFMENQNDIN